jgi:hypothetical protein
VTALKKQAFFVSVGVPMTMDDSLHEISPETAQIKYEKQNQLQYN